MIPGIYRNGWLNRRISCEGGTTDFTDYTDQIHRLRDLCKSVFIRVFLWSNQTQKLRTTNHTNAQACSHSTEFSRSHPSAPEDIFNIRVNSFHSWFSFAHPKIDSLPRS